MIIKLLISSDTTDCVRTVTVSTFFYKIFLHWQKQRKCEIKRHQNVIFNKHKENTSQNKGERGGEEKVSVWACEGNVNKHVKLSFNYKVGTDRRHRK